MSPLRHPRQHDDLLNFQLKRLLAIGGAPAIRLCEGRFGVSRLEWRIVAALVEGGPMSPSGLASRTGVEQARTSRALATLVEKGLVQRTRDAHDGRRAMLRPTLVAERLYRELFPELARINERLMAVLDDDEARVLEQCLRKMTEQARRIQAEGGGVHARADRRRGGSRRVWSASLAQARGSDVEG